MNLTEAKEEVVEITKRPEKELEILSQINRAIAFYTMKADFALDLVESQLVLDPTLYGQVVDLSTLTRFRKIKFLRPTSQRVYLHAIGSDKLITPNGKVQPNRFFVGGTNLTITLGQLDSSLEIGYYTFSPTLTESVANDTYWMLDRMPWAITELAAAQIFRSIGDDASYTRYKDSSMEFFLAARRDYSDSVLAEAT